MSKKKKMRYNKPKVTLKFAPNVLKSLWVERFGRIDFIDHNWK